MTNETGERKGEMTNKAIEKIATHLYDGKDIVVICDSKFHAGRAQDEIAAYLGARAKKYGGCIPHRVQFGGATCVLTVTQESADRRPSEHDAVFTMLGEVEAL